MKRYFAVLAVLFVLMMVSSVPNRADIDKSSLKPNDRFMLTVTLASPYNHQFEVNLPIILNKPFKIEATNGSVTNIISGTVGSPLQGKYPLPFYLSEASAAGDTSIKGTSQYELELDKPVSIGVVSSFVFNRTVKLSRMPY